ncbi:MAG: leucine-rich repeat domain-containing protein, partial [Clostridia bacterium]|nr:leucine-rich repeat domain-containing protein [Clostridia bacterium]
MSDFIIKNGVLEKYTGEESKVVIPDSVTEIGEMAFLVQTTLKEIIIPSSVTKIGEHAFVCCVSLKEITIPSSVTEIGEYAFY